MPAENVSTDIPGFDRMVDGGLPKGNVILILGGPGAGKTIFSSQFLYNGAKEQNERGVFASLDETKEKYYSEMMGFDWDFRELEEDGIFGFIDAAPAEERAMKEGLPEAVSNVGADRLVIDSITSFLYLYPESNSRRNATLELVKALEKSGSTCFVTAELREMNSESRGIQLEEYLTHGVVILQAINVGGDMVRALQVEKMRGSKIDAVQRPYEITGDGIEVYSDEKVYLGGEY